ncbi:hypothetical protein [Sphingomonas lenta]|uniref:hypothetical protein n=1 Tax=Sphingomonas lenta TaxID=1141887 RepID=UPI001140FE5B|nr:hypothetical protein [Sphingomonas lenta]
MTHIRTDWDLEQGDRFRLPTTDEIDWIVEAAAQANFKVIRTWCFPSFLQPENPASTHYFHRNPDGITVTLDEPRFRLFDYFLARCRELGVYAQVPFVFLIGVDQWADAAGDPHPQLLDFVEKVIGRVNTRTGVRYRDDPTIFCWESGNEAKPTARWIAALAAFVKRLDPNHLFMDGRWGASDIYDSYRDPALARNRDIDIVSVHTYERRPKGWTNPRMIGELNRLLRAQGRALDVGEIDPNTSVDELAAILKATIDGGVASASWWSFKGARAKGGYTHWNGKEWGGNDDLKWPGFVSPLEGVKVEKAKLDLLWSAAYAIEGRRRPAALPAPTPAKLLPIRDVGHISWIPGTGEQVADVERSTRPDGGFAVIASAFETFRASTYDLYCDATAEPGQRYYYRIRSRNSGGMARYSNVVGPVAVPARWLVDDLWDLEKTSSHSRACRIESDYDLVPYHADLSVLTSTDGEASVIYGLAGNLSTLRLISNRDTASLFIEASADGRSWSPIRTRRRVHPPFHAEFKGHPRITHEADGLEAKAYTHVRLRFGREDAISRVELSHA